MPPALRVRVLAAALLAVLLALGPPARAQQGEAAQGAQAQSARPNVLIAISDDQSWPHASAYGAEWVETPAFDRVAEEGTLFMNALAASPGCSPSRAALLTGRYPWQLEEAGTHASSFPKAYVTLPDLLESAGYAVGHTGKGWGPGNWKISGRTRNPAGPAFGARTIDPPLGHVSGTDYAGNFAAFLSAHAEGQPFYFWYGASEPHLPYEAGAGRALGKDLSAADPPAFLPDAPEVRGNLLDYAAEIEHFDRHLAHMLKTLEAAGRLEDTIVIVTSDNGMPLPRAKANLYEYGLHVPLAIRWGNRVPGGQARRGHRVEVPVSLIDLMPTVLEAAGVEHPAGAPPMAGRSLVRLLTAAAGAEADTAEASPVEADTAAVYAARERHSSSRWRSLSYPQRAIRTQRYLYIRNFKPERWPAGAPRKYEDDGALGPEHAAYHDIDASRAMAFLVNHRDDPAVSRYFHLAVDRRPGEELYDIEEDPACVNNLAGDPAYADVQERLRTRLERYLQETQDPRVTGRGDVFETYKRYSGLRTFPQPAWAEEAESPPNPGWLPENEDGR